MLATAHAEVLHQEPGSSPVGSLSVAGLLLAYAYPCICCGWPVSITGSRLTNRPVPGSYSRAPRWVRPVGSLVPPTKPLSLGHAGWVPRGAPKGMVRRLVTASVAGSMVTVAVPWWSPACQCRPVAPRTATRVPAWW